VALVGKRTKRGNSRLCRLKNLSNSTKAPLISGTIFYALVNFSLQKFSNNLKSISSFFSKNLLNEYRALH
jgi:hypothetical protein